MRNFLFVLAVLAICLSGPAFADEQCADVLRAGVFNQTQTFDSELGRLSYLNWQCTTEFKNHNEALAAGLNVGFLVYDVPIQVGGTWAQSHVEQWKKTHCSEDSLQTDHQRATVSLIRAVAPEVISGWIRCWELKTPASAIACDVEQKAGAVVFSARWVRTPGDQNTPLVKYYEALNTKCNRQLAVGEAFDDAGVSIPCSPNSKADPSFVLDTTRGRCFKTYESPKTSRTFSGKTILTDNEFIQVDEAIFEPNAVIVTNGHQLTIAARNLKVNGGVPKIVSFELHSNRPSGEDGRSAAPITLQAETFSGTALEIQNFGEPGMNGRDGRKGSTGSSGQQGQQASWDPLHGCHDRTESSGGGAGGAGEDGSDGGRGGDGGNVTLKVCGLSQADPLQRIRVTNIKGGSRGQGGNPGPGGDGGPGGAAVPGTNLCGGGGPGAPGSTGSPGRAGKTPDRDGGPGQIFWLPCSE